MTERPSYAWLLAQSDVWVDFGGNTHQLKNMDLRYCENVRAYLVRRAGNIASSLYSSIARGPVPQGDMACDAYDSMLDELTEASINPEPWINSQPLVVALKERIESLDAPPAPETRSVAVVLKLQAPVDKGTDAIERKLTKALKGLPYEYEIISVTD